MQKIKSFVKLLCPPIILSLWRRLTFKPSFILTDRWEDQPSNPFSSESWIQHTLSKLGPHPEYKNGDMTTHRFVLASLVGSLSKDRLIKVVDFGGGAGELYSACISRAIPERVNYFVVDDAKLIKIGAAHNKAIHFIDSSTASVGDLYEADVMFLSGVLQYVKEWESLLEFLLAAKPRFLVVCRHFSPDKARTTRYAKQHIKTKHGDAGACPLTLVNWKHVLSEVEDNPGYRLVSTLITDKPCLFGPKIDATLGITERLMIFKAIQ